MRLFKRHRSSAKSEPTIEESQKSWGVFRLFQAGGSALTKEPAADVDRSLRLCLDDSTEAATSKRAQAADESDEYALFNPCSTNQNYTPEVALSPNSLPMASTVLPLHPPADSHNSGGGDAKAAELARFERWQRRKPRFHFGPRGAPEDEEGDSERRGSAGEAASGSSVTDNIITLPPKYAFIYQDGKFVEREVTRWPKPQRALPHLRYRILEPYATHYGRRYRRRLNSQERIVSTKHRLIYQNPIYRLPRKIMEENKSRLMTRHSLKDSFEGSEKAGGPQKVEVGEKLQSKMIMKMQERHNLKEAEKLVSYITNKGKASKSA